MDKRTNLLHVLIFIFLFAKVVVGLKLNHRRPSTVWGVQQQFFKTQKDYHRTQDGAYYFEYDTGYGENQIFRKERRYPDGTVVGVFGYVDPEGILRITEYLAGSFGYKQRTVLRFPVTNELH